MKFVIAMVAVLWASATAFAQPASQSTNGSKVTVLKYSWSKERIGWEQDPFSGPNENFDEMRVRARNEKRISDAKRGGNGAEVSRAERDAATDQALVSTIHQSSRPRYGFLYRVVVQNNSARTIKSIDWDYVFVDENAQIEVGRRKFTSVENISPGKTKELKFFISRPPTQTISVNSLNEKERKGLSEDVTLIRIEYSDGSVWQQP
jgi:hypothetical protein